LSWWSDDVGLYLFVTGKVMKQRTLVTHKDSQRGIAMLTSITRNGTPSHLPTRPCRYGTRADLLFGPT
jgi:hypothetical protein